MAFTIKVAIIWIYSSLTCHQKGITFTPSNFAFKFSIMSSSIVVANIPLSVSDVTLLKFAGEKFKTSPVKHIQPFPDAYHFINEAASSRSVQLFFDDSEDVDAIKRTFEDENTIRKLIEMEKELSASHDLAADFSAPQTVRRLSVTTA